MRKILWAALTLLCLAIGVPDASADTTYRIDFTGSPLVSGTFVADGTNQVTTVTIIFDGTTYDLTSANFIVGVGIGLGCDALSEGSLQFLVLTGTATPTCKGIFPGGFLADTISGFLILSGTTEDIPTTVQTTSMYIKPLAPNSPDASATWDSVTIISTPEPGTVGLVLVGIGLVVATRRRLLQGFQQLA